jgi:putative ubiquitin-RnfH superfamily antitoxin RatB of RatAB toxin-antitoxin module
MRMGFLELTLIPDYRGFLLMILPPGGFIALGFLLAGKRCWTEQAIEHSGMLKRFPDIDLETQRVGIFGKLAKLNSPVKDGDRVEIYRDITADPETVERRDVVE